jgi:hypothetical protein
MCLLSGRVSLQRGNETKMIKIFGQEIVTAVNKYIQGQVMPSDLQECGEMLCSLWGGTRADARCEAT